MVRKYFTLTLSLCFAHMLHSTPLPNTITGIVNDPSATIIYPASIAIMPDGTLGYVSSQVAQTGSINIIHMATNTVIGLVDDPASTLTGINTIAISPNGNVAYVSNTPTSTVSILDTEEYSNCWNTILGTVNDPYDTLAFPNAIAFTPDGKKAYVVNGYPGSVSVIDSDITSPQYYSITKIVHDPDSTFNAPASIAVSPDGTKAYVGNTNNNTVSIIDVATDTVTGIINAGSFPFNSPYAIVFASNETAYVTNFNGNNINIIDVAIDSVTGTIHDPSNYLSGPRAANITPDNATIYVACAGNKVAIVDVKTNTATGYVSDPLSTLNAPYSIAFTPDGDIFGYITNLYGNSVSIAFVHYAPSPSPVLPPSSVQGCKTKNVFFTQTDYINRITWTAPTSGLTPVKYKIYRDAALMQPLATISATGPLEYYDHNRQPNITYSYYIVAIDQNNQISSAASITVTDQC